MDDYGEPLHSSGSYRLTFGLGELPEASYCWSLTVYELPSYRLVKNPIDRYSWSSACCQMQTGCNGYVHLSLQANPPRDLNLWRVLQNKRLLTGGNVELALRFHLFTDPLVAKMKDEEKVLPTDEADDVHVFIPYKAQLEFDGSGARCPCAYRILEFFVLSSEIRNCRPLLHQG